MTSRIIPTWAGLPDKPSIGDLAGVLPLDKLPAHTHSWNDLPGLLPLDKLPAHNHSNLVPYSGATGAVNLGSQNLNAGSVFAGTAGTSNGQVVIGAATSINAKIIIGGSANNVLSGYSNVLGQSWALFTDTTGSSGPAQLRLGSTGSLGFGNSAANIGSITATLSRAADGVLQIGTTSNNSLGSLILSNLTASTLTVNQVGLAPFLTVNSDYGQAIFKRGGGNTLYIMDASSNNLSIQESNKTVQGYLWLNSSSGAQLIIGNGGTIGRITPIADGISIGNAGGSGYGAIKAGFLNSTSPPNTTTLTAGGSVWWQDTTANTRRQSYNDGGVIYQSPLLKSTTPATPTDLASVISVLQHWGLCA